MQGVVILGIRRNLPGLAVVPFRSRRSLFPSGSFNFSIEAIILSACSSLALAFANAASLALAVTPCRAPIMREADASFATALHPAECRAETPGAGSRVPTAPVPFLAVMHSEWNPAEAPYRCRATACRHPRTPPCGTVGDISLAGCRGITPGVWSPVWPIYALWRIAATATTSLGQAGNLPLHVGVGLGAHD